LVAWPQLVRCGRIPPLLRLPAKADDEHPVAAITASARVRAGLLSLIQLVTSWTCDLPFPDETARSVPPRSGSLFVMFST